MSKNKIDFREVYESMTFTEDIFMVRHLINNYHFPKEMVYKLFSFNKDDIRTYEAGKIINKRNLISVNSSCIRQSLFRGKSYKKMPKVIITPKIFHMVALFREIGYSFKFISEILGCHITTPAKALMR